MFVMGGQTASGLVTTVEKIGIDITDSPCLSTVRCVRQVTETERQIDRELSMPFQLTRTCDKPKGAFVVDVVCRRTVAGTFQSTAAGLLVRRHNTDLTRRREASATRW